MNARWAPAGDALFIEGATRGVRNLWRLDVDPATFGFAGGPVRLTTGGGDRRELAIAPSGDKLAFVTKTETSRLWSFPFDARTRRVTGEADADDAGEHGVADASISANGTTLAYAGCGAESERHGAVDDVARFRSARLLREETLSFFSRAASRAMGPSRHQNHRVKDWRDGGSPGTRVGRGGEQCCRRARRIHWTGRLDGERILHFCLSPTNCRRRCATSTTATAVETRPLVATLTTPSGRDATRPMAAGFCSTRRA